MILILTHKDDEHADIVEAALGAKNVDYFRLITTEFPSTARATIEFEASRREAYLWSNGQHIDLRRVKSIWNRRYVFPSGSNGLCEDDRRFMRRESEHMLKSLWHLLSDRFWVNPILANTVGELKPYQLAVAAEIGFEIPRTIVTSDPSEALRFFDESRIGVVYKTLSGHHVASPDGRYLAVYTNVIRRDDLLSRTEEIRIAPCLFQEYVPKKSELRVTVIGNKIFAAEIDSQANTRTKDDWRRDDPARTRHSVYAIPEPTRRKIEVFMARLGLVFGCLDFVITPDERLVFLEVNPAGQWYWIEQLTALPLLNSFVEMLIQGKPTYLCAGISA